MLCRVEKCLGVISVGPGFYLSWVYFSIASMSTVTAVSVCRSLYHCIYSVFHFVGCWTSPVLYISHLMFNNLKITL
jgi:hypothetical protein